MGPRYSPTDHGRSLEDYSSQNLTPAIIQLQHIAGWKWRVAVMSLRKLSFVMFTAIWVLSHGF